MSFSFPNLNGLKDRRQARRQTQDERINEENRQQLIVNDLSADIRDAMGIVRSREGREDAAHVATVKVYHWLPNSVIQLQYYSKLEDPEDAMLSDIAYFMHAVDVLRNKNHGWEFTVEYASNISRVPVRILVQKKA